jgi:hypothetical protein
MIFAQEAIIHLNEADFDIDLSLKRAPDRQRPQIILFYDDCSTSKDLVRIFGLIATQILMPMGAVNLIRESKLIELLKQSNKSIPCILIYGSNTINVYDGELTADAIINYLQLNNLITFN